MRGVLQLFTAIQACQDEVLIWLGALLMSQWAEHSPSWGYKIAYLSLQKAKQHQHWNSNTHHSNISIFSKSFQVLSIIPIHIKVSSKSKKATPYFKLAPIFILCPIVKLYGVYSFPFERGQKFCLVWSLDCRTTNKDSLDAIIGKKIFRHLVKTLLSQNLWLVRLPCGV